MNSHTLYRIGLMLFMLITLNILNGLAQDSFSTKGNSDWPSWGGHGGDFTAENAGMLKPDQAYSLKVAWKKPLGSGYSFISVKDNRAVTMFSDDVFDYVIALDANNGAELWRFKMDSTFLGHFGSVNGPISTPLLTEDKVFALNAHGHLFAWMRRQAKNFGKAASPETITQWSHFMVSRRLR